MKTKNLQNNYLTSFNMSLHGQLRWFCLKLKWSLFRRTCFSLWFLGFVFHLGVIFLIFPWKTPKNISKMHALCDTGSLLCPLLWVISTLLTSCWPYLNLTNRQLYHFKPLVKFSNLGRVISPWWVHSMAPGPPSEVVEFSEKCWGCDRAFLCIFCMQHSPA